MKPLILLLLTVGYVSASGYHRYLPPRYHQDICQLPKVQGPCDAHIPSWFFNSATNKCEQFIYGGCGGNRNRFVSEEACQEKCGKPQQDICQLPKVQGPCEAYIPSWFFNSVTNKCEQFIYGGCEGNENNFDSEEACQKKCGKPQHVPCGSRYCRPDEVCKPYTPICFNPDAYCPTLHRCVKDEPISCDLVDCPKLPKPNCIQLPPKGDQCCPVECPDCTAVLCLGPTEGGINCKNVPIPGECCPKWECEYEATCDGHKCPVGKVCELIQPQCVTTPCPKLPTCVQDCTVVRCAGPPAGGINCKSIPIPGQCCPRWECEFPEPTCDGHKCPVGEVCELIQPQCVTTPCPKQPTCVSRPDCRVVLCAGPPEGGINCTSIPIPGQCCPKWECEFNEPTCVNFKCPGGELCKLIQPHCIAAPCPQIPRCVPIPERICDDRRCPPGQVCKLFPTQCKRPPCFGIPRCVPRPDPTCDGHRCPDGQVCELTQPQCITTPCPPVPTCVPIPEPSCKDHKCPIGTLCKLLFPSCATPPCHPVPTCVALREPTCEDHRCPTGQVCELIQPHCFTTPCPPVPICVPFPEPTCKGHKCPVGEVCKLLFPPCPGPPCHPIPTCVPLPISTCDGHRCPAGEVCELIQPQCFTIPCFPVPTCVPLPDPTCDGHRCPPGEVCRLIQPQCIRAPCPKIPSCVPRPEKPGLCPRPSGVITTCQFRPGINCIRDSECPARKKCCSEGCGKICKNPIFPMPPRPVKG